MGVLVVNFLIALIIICVLAAIVLWAVRRFFPDIYEPARYLVGAVALIAILIKALPLVQRVL